ncbi:MAG: aminoacyl-histidine dipeptidase [Myxococcota bacterium]
MKRKDGIPNFKRVFLYEVSMSNKDVIKGLKPEPLWRYFAEICNIPHGSKNMSLITARLTEMLSSLKLKVKRDKIGNICAEVPASRGRESAPIVVLQAHIDMVCEKNKSKRFDFLKDPILMTRDGDWIRADGTSLGADNGIGVAAALAVAAEKDAVHGPLEILLTVDEETGMTGAFNIEPSLVNGRMLINLDSEEMGAIYVGCAGGSSADVHLDVEWSDVRERETAVKVTIEGLLGGHSGTDIHLGRGNAIKFLARMLKAGEKLGLRLVSLEGGNKHNAIPREAQAVCVIEESKISELERIASEKRELFLTELDEGHSLQIKIKEQKAPAKATTRDSTVKILNLLVAVPNGVMSVSREIPGLVETSGTLAIARLDGDGLSFLSSLRSSVESRLDNAMAQFGAIGQGIGAKVTITDGYPGWHPNMNSKLLRVVRESAKKTFGEEFAVTAIHAGLECGVLGSRIPEMEMVSFGPDIRNPHSPNEKVHIQSVEKFYKLLLKVLEELSGR